MNWRRWILGTWLVVSVLWVALFVWLYIGLPEPGPVRYDGSEPTPDEIYASHRSWQLTFATAALLPPIGLFVVGWCIAWFAKRFSK
jgi:hypothetical protein